MISLTKEHDDLILDIIRDLSMSEKIYSRIRWYEFDCAMTGYTREGCIEIEYSDGSLREIEIIFSEDENTSLIRPLSLIFTNRGEKCVRDFSDEEISPELVKFIRCFIHKTGTSHETEERIKRENQVANNFMKKFFNTNRENEH